VPSISGRVVKGPLLMLAMGWLRAMLWVRMPEA